MRDTWEEKVRILRSLLQYYDDGRQKDRYDLLVDLLSRSALRALLDQILERTAAQEIDQRRTVAGIRNLLDSQPARSRSWIRGFEPESVFHLPCPTSRWVHSP